MDLSEAKQFYVTHHGNSFLMWREAPDEYEKFSACKPDDALLNDWDREMLHDHEAFILGQDSPDKWIVFQYYFDALESLSRRANDSVPTYLETFYRLTDHMASSPDARQKILIMEHFGGRNAALSNGIIKRITALPVDKPRLLACIKRLTTFKTSLTSEHELFGLEAPKERYKTAKKTIKRAIRLYF